MTEAPTEQSPEGISVLFGRSRYAILMLSTVCLTLAMSNSLALNFTIICMQDVVESQNTTVSVHWLESSSHTNALFSAIGLGCLIGTLPLTFLINRYGIGATMSLYGLISALSTILFPLAVWVGYPAVFLTRALQGMATSLSYPANCLIASQWSTHKGAGAFIAILSCHRQFCSIFTMPVAGTLCESSLGWRSLYYLQGTVSLLIFSTFYVFYDDKPLYQRTTGPKEWERISRGKENQAEDGVVPYWAICTDPCVIGIWISTIGGSLGFQIFLLYGPTYVNKVLGYDVKSTGIATALPFILSAIMKFTLGPVSDKATFISQRTRLIFFAAVSQGVMAVCFVILAFWSSPLLAQITYSTAVVSSGINAVGTVKCASMVFRQHVYFVMSVVSFVICLIGLTIPVAVDIVCPNNTSEEWSRIFLGIGVIVFLASTPFVFVARDTPAAWTKNTVQPPSIPSREEEKEVFKRETKVY